MAIFGAILLIIGVVLFFVQKNYSTKLRSIQSAIPATVAELQKIASEIAAEIGSGNLREYVKVRGLIRSDRPLLSELKQQPCVHYTMRVVREYEEKIQTTDSVSNLPEMTLRRLDCFCLHLLRMGLLPILDCLRSTQIRILKETSFILPKWNSTRLLVRIRQPL